MKILRTAVVGLGRIGWRTHIPRIIERPDKFKLVAVVDVAQERLDEARDTYGVNGYTDLAAMIEAEKPDLVVIASPTHLHHIHACTAMTMGCDVFLDKPMAVDYETACKIADCAKETGRKLMIYQPRRAGAEPNQLKDIIASGKIGRLCSIQRNSYSYVRRADWQSFKKFGGGMLNNYGAHQIDAMIYLTEQKVKRLHCFKDIVASMGDADDVVKVLFRMENGVTVDININQAASVAGPEWIIYGTCGGIISQTGPNGKTQQFRIRYYDPTAVPELIASDALAAANRSYSSEAPLPWVEEVIDLDSSYAITFYEKVYEYFGLDQEPFVPVEQTLYVMELISRCHADADAE